MGSYGTVTGPSGIEGLYFKDPKEAEDLGLVMAIMAKDNIPFSLLHNGHRIVPNTFDNNGGCFIMFGSFLLPGEIDTTTPKTK